MQTCPECGSTFEASARSCPGCQRLVHRDQLIALSQQAKAHAAAGETSEELAAWRQALDLLPVGSRQHGEVLQRVQALSNAVVGATDVLARDVSVSEGVATTTRDSPSEPKGWPAGLGAVGLVLWKLKFVLVFVLTKLKFLLLGLTKIKTLLSMLLTMGVYWTMWGWPFAVGFVLSIYVHEIGHVAALRRLGIKASAPMFIPGLGAFVRMHQYPATPAEDARVGLAGPIWGAGAAIATYFAFLASGWDLLAGVARAGAWVNLFNLLPIWQLDGGRAFKAMSKPERVMAAGVLLAAWFFSAETLLLILAIAAGARCFMGQAPQPGSRYALVAYSTLVILLSLMTLIHVPGLPRAQ